MNSSKTSLLEIQTQAFLPRAALNNVCGQMLIYLGLQLVANMDMIESR